MISLKEGNVDMMINIRRTISIFLSDLKMPFVIAVTLTICMALYEYIFEVQIVAPFVNALLAPFN